VSPPATFCELLLLLAPLIRLYMSHWFNQGRGQDLDLRVQSRFLCRPSFVGDVAIRRVATEGEPLSSSPVSPPSTLSHLSLFATHIPYHTIPPSPHPHPILRRSAWSIYAASADIPFTDSPFSPSPKDTKVKQPGRSSQYAGTPEEYKRIFSRSVHIPIEFVGVW
jgi:hypothetical protein